MAVIDPREVTTKLLAAIDEGLLSETVVLQACLEFLSEDEVADMADMNDFLTDEEDRYDEGE